MSRQHPFVVLQQDQSDCGIACLLSIIKHHGGNSNFEELRRLSGTTKQGTTLLGLKQAAESIGFDSEGLEAEYVSNLGEVAKPAILHVVLEGKLQHYMVYWPEDSSDGKSTITLSDPAKGIVEMTRDALDKIWVTKALLSLQPNKNFKTSTFQNKEKRSWILNLVRDDFNILLISLFLGLFVAALNLSTALFSQKLIDSILPSGNVKKLVLSLVMLGLLLFVRSGLGYLRGLFIVRQSADFNNRIINWFYAKLLQLPKSFFDTRKTGDLIARMHDTRRIQAALSLLSGSIAIDVLVILVSLMFVAAYSWLIAGILLLAVPVFITLALFFNKPIVSAQKDLMAGYAFAESHFVDTVQGVADIKLFNRQGFFERINSTVYGQFQERAKELGHINIRFGLTTDVISTLILLGVFGLAAYSVLSKEMLVGELVALLGMASAVLPTLTRLVVANIQLQEALVAFDRMFEFTSVAPEGTRNDYPPKEFDPEGISRNSMSTSPWEKVRPNKKIVFRDAIETLSVQKVSFRFPGRKQILTNISFPLKRGEIVCLLGESGRGKSTLLQIIQKFYSPESGEIIVNGANLTNISSTQWRHLIGSVQQSPKIFNGTLLYNITLSDDAVTNQEAINFCEQNGFVPYFDELPQSYLSLVGEEGINLSGGQKQLVAVARALFRNPRLLLLDEATVSMDKQMESFVMDLVQTGKSERITVVVTHQQSLSSQCDRIIEI